MNIADKESKYFFHTYKRLELDIERGEGSYLVAKDGKRYLDMFGGIAVNALGYNHPKVNEAIFRQVKRYLHVSNMFVQDTQVELAELLLGASGFSRIFFTNSGTEAMEGALKLIRKWGKSRGKIDIIGLSDSFHGRTLGSLSITGRDKYREGYDPLLPNTRILKFNSLEELERNVNAETLAVVLEFIQGEGGINLVTSEYVEMLNRLRSKFGFLVVADEIQSGIGRTGKLFGFEHFNFSPDIVVVAKAIGGGLPLGALLAREHLSEVFSPGSHGTTFGGNPVACAAGIATVQEILHGGVMKNAEAMGTYLKARLAALQEAYPDYVVDVRGLGLMVGLELKFDGTEFNNKLLAKGVLLNLTNSTILRWLPPLNVRKEEIDKAIDTVSSVLTEIANPATVLVGLSSAGGR